MEEQPDAPQSERRAERSLKWLVEPRWPERVPPGVASPGAPEQSQATMKPETILSEAQRRAQEQQESPVAQPPRMPERSPLASRLEAQPSRASPLEHA
jgi:hypothetical protein